MPGQGLPGPELTGGAQAGGGPGQLHQDAAKDSLEERVGADRAEQGRGDRKASAAGQEDESRATAEPAPAPTPGRVARRLVEEGTAPTPGLLPGESQGRRGLVGYSPWGHKESDTTKQHTHTGD